MTCLENKNCVYNLSRKNEIICERLKRCIKSIVCFSLNNNNAFNFRFNNEAAKIYALISKLYLLYRFIINKVLIMRKSFSNLRFSNFRELLRDLIDLP